jgi:retron-type reverse transcriptase
MRNPTDVLNSLNKQSTQPKYRYQRLYRNLYNPEFYLLAYKNIYANEGSMTPGVNGETMDGMSSPRIERIIASLKDHSYQPTPARRTYIAKKNSKKKRPLGIPSGDDKLVQEVVRMILESIYEPTFTDTSHGFRPHRSCHTALEQIQRTFAGVNWFVEGDIQACFDSFDHHVLIDILRRRIDDEAFITLMWKFLKAGYMEQWQYHKTYCGTPQGSGISPILANIYLHELDTHIGEYKAEFVKGNRFSRKQNREWQKLGRDVRRYKVESNAVWDTLSDDEKKRRAGILRQMKEKQRSVPSRLFRDETYKNLQYVRYADDFIIGVIGSKEDAEAVKTDLTAFLKDKLCLTLSAEKTKITYSAEKARFLGYDIAISKSQEILTRKDGVKLRGYSGAVKLYVPHEKWEAKLLEYGAIRIKKDKISQKEHWKAIHRPKLINLRDIEILSKYNAEVRGLYNYYSLACNVCAISKFSSLMKYSMLKTFANKYRTTANKIKDRYAKDGQFTVEYPTKSGMKTSVYYNKPFIRLDHPNIEQADVLPPYKRYDKPNRLASKLRAKTCELCGIKTDEVLIHQVKRLKDLTRQTVWETVMLKNRRKTLAVCPACHDEIHNK